MSSQEAVHVSLIKVTPRSGKGTLGTWWCHRQRGGKPPARSEPGKHADEPTTILIRAHSRFFSGHPLSRLLGDCGPDRFFSKSPFDMGTVNVKHLVVAQPINQI